MNGDYVTYFDGFGVEYIPKISWHIFTEYKNTMQWRAILLYWTYWFCVE